MKITLFTSNNFRHVYLINLLSKFCDELRVIQECKTKLTGLTSDRYPASNIFKKYFENVDDAQKKLFKHSYINQFNKNIKILSIKYGDLNKCTLDALSEFLNSDYYIVFGASYIKGDIVDYLVENKAINIHAGVCPYYRGTDCNFWALYDNNPHLVGSTILMLSKGLDNGPMLYHALSNLKSNPFEYTMSTVKSAFHSIVERIKDKSIFNIEPMTQDKSKEIRYSKKVEFNEEVIKNYFSKSINLNSKQFNLSLLKSPYFYSE